MSRVALLALVLMACGSESAPLPADVPADNPCATAGQPCGCAGFPVRQGVLECVGGGVVCVCATPDSGVMDIPALMDAGSPVEDILTSEDRSVPADGPTMDTCTGQSIGNCCGVTCTMPPNAMTAACVAGRCGVGMCIVGFADCDGTPSNGCETNTNTDAMHCGACRAPCATGRNCVMGACVLECPAGYANCDGTDANGCEAVLRSPSTCGACDRRCNAGDMTTTLHGAWQCRWPEVTDINTRCVLACSSGYADCDRNPTNGCETSTQESATNCGACGSRCVAPRICRSGVCQN